MDAGGVGAVNGHMEVMALVLISLQLNGILGVVFELKVQHIPVHGGVSAHHGHIPAVESVLVALHDLQIGFQSGPIEGGGQLADAAGGGVHALAVLIGARRLVAAGLGVGTGVLVVGEGFSRQNNHTIAPGSRQVDVEPTTGPVVGGTVGGGGAQHILKEVGGELFGGHGGHGEIQRHGAAGALGGLGQRRGSGGDIEAHTGDGRNNVLGFRV